MKQLSIQDVGFLYQETDTTPMHICGVGVYDQAGVKGKRPKKAGIIKYMNDRLHLAPILKQKLVSAPREIERPYWDEDADFDIKKHVRQITIKKPGNREQLNELVSELIEAPLDMSRPLWEVTVIEGLNDYEDAAKGSFAILTKIHHACIDGASGNNVMSVLHDMEPNAKPIVLPANDEETQEQEPQRGHYETIARAYANNLAELAEQSSAVTKRVPGLLKTAVDLYRGKKDSGAKLTVPATRFNQQPDKGRVYNASEYAIDDIKAIKNAVEGATVNDVMVAIISGGARKYLEHHKELPAESLGATMPQNTRTAETADAKHGNHVGGLFATIHTNIADPLQRLNAIHDSIIKAKKFAVEENTASVFPTLMGGFLYPRVGKKLMGAAQKYNVMGRLGPLMMNTVITNVPGPDFTLYHHGAKMVSYSGVLPLVDGVGFGHAIYSYNGTITISIVSCPSMMSDSDFYMECCDEAFIELWNATNVAEDTREEMIEVDLLNDEEIEVIVEEDQVAAKKAGNVNDEADDQGLNNVVPVEEQLELPKVASA